MTILTALDPFQFPPVPLGDWVETLLSWLVTHFRDVFIAMKQPFQMVLNAIESTFRATPSVVMLALLILSSWQVGGAKTARTVGICFIAIGLLGAWPEAMTTLAIVLTSIVFCLLIGIPLGILSARSDRTWKIVQPVVDFMQTTPSFCYLVPVVMLFGIGNVSGVIVIVFHSIPPIIRLTNLGIREVRPDMVEAAISFGTTPRQLLFKVQLPLAAPTIMAGINQTIMMCLSMAVVASMIAVTGLGQMVLRGIGRLDMALATIGGLSIVLMAIAIDRTAQSAIIVAGARGPVPWYRTGPVGLVVRTVGRARIRKEAWRAARLRAATPV